MNIEQYDQLLESSYIIRELINKEKLPLKARKVILRALITIKDTILKSHDKELIRILSDYGFDKIWNIYLCRIILDIPFYMGAFLIGGIYTLLSSFVGLFIDINILARAILASILVFWPFILIYFPYKKKNIIDKIFFFSYDCIKILNDKNDFLKKSLYLKGLYSSPKSKKDKH
ncbi:hypothetical protein [Dysgonomonas sp. 25]|uniref:hypothetical protein n=1 Tax=Dysgonomonas sp. 25 TaxID=2302933 RepID=UPI0013D269F3|nr:hypothetical protein [Dysgonomonas sp. 25]NDV70043.1 hypothetical protein [Dysgonomonas sp. 25]